jgi:hypothetical protein
MAQLLSLERVYGDGRHNAFTDLLQWRGYTYLCFRASENHGIEPPGEIVVLRSADLQAWEECGRLRTAGDDRDPKLVDMGERIAVTFGTWFPRWADQSIASEPYDLISHVCYSRDGTSWSAPRQMWSPNYWLWRVFKEGEGYLCPAYHFPARSHVRAARTAHLLRSNDLLDWQFVTVMRQGFDGGEPALYRPDGETLRCVLRAVEPDHHSWLGQSVAPYTEWEWSDLGVMIHAPVVLGVGEKWIVAGRSQEEDLPEGVIEPTGSHHTSVWEIVGDRAEHLLTVPSAGDCSYCGLAMGPAGEVLMSYYSQHERLPLPEGQPTPDDIFLARFAV